VINQQVNLFQPIFRKERKLLSFRVLVQACGLVLALLLLLSGWGWRQTQQVEADLALLQGQLQQRTQQLADITTRLAGMKTDSGPQKELAGLEQELVARQKVVDALTRVRDSYTRGVSPYLEGFSRQTPKGVWLTGFMVRAGGDGLVLRGSSLQPALVPTFLQQLSTEPALTGTQFGLLQIQREQAVSRHVDFTVYTGTEPPAPPSRELMP
jgi:Tfp pilus assembly protein PilN